MTVIRNFGVSGVASTLEFGKRGGTLNYDDTTKVFSFALSSALTIPAGTDTQRPTTGTLGMLRVNTQSTPVLELYNGSTWTAIGTSTGTGSVTTVSVITANGFTGTVANSTTTPAITLQTTVDGLLKGSSGSLVVASTTTDYQVPLQLTTTGTGAATFNGSILNIPTNTATGSVTNFSIVNTNGFSGTVANSTTTPQLTLQTTINGVLKGLNGELASASTTTDYQVPINVTTIGTGLATFDGRTLNIPPAMSITGTGGVISVSFINGNGFAGTVEYPTTTAGISVKTSVDGLLKGENGSLVQASSATDYQIPITLTTTGSGAATLVGGTLNIPTNTATGSVTDVSIASANGFTGSVVNSSTTPIITLKTSLGDGVLKSVAGSLVTASTATDYQVPLTLTTTGTGSATFNGSILNIPTPVASTYTGTVINVSIESNNGFTGTVTNSTTAPSITLRTTTADGLLKSVSGALVTATTSDYQVPLTLTTTGTGAATFNGSILNIPTNTSSGSVTNFSIVNTNGFSGTVANSNTTPELTLQTTISGLLKGSAGSLVLASTTTDYQVPITLTTTGTGAATFNGSILNIPIAGSGSGSVTTVSVVSANGFTGTVDNATTTPAITLGTTVNGLLKGSAGNLVVASSATDYQIPISLTTTGTGAATFDGSVLNIPVPSPGSTGTVTNVSVAQQNGFTGTVLNSTTTPEIILGITVDGLLKGSGGTLVAATATDYQVPITLTTTGTGAATFNGSILNIPTVATGVTQILAGTNVTLSSTGATTGTGVVTINVSATTATTATTAINLAGGAATQISYQSSASVTAFSSKLTWNNVTNVFSIGEFGATSSIRTSDALGSFPAGSILIKAGNASSGANPGDITLSGGDGSGADFSGGNLILQGGQGATLGSGSVVIRTSSAGTLIDRVRFLPSGAWSVGNNPTFTGAPGQVLTSQGPNLPPQWQTVTSTATAGVIQVLAGVGIAISPSDGTGIVTINATGAGGGSPGGSNGSIQYNNSDAFSGTNQLLYNGSNQLTLGALNSTFTITTISGSLNRAANLIIKSGDQISGGSQSSITIAGGSSQDNNVNGANVFIDGGLGSGTAPSTGGTIYLRTSNTNSLITRLQIDPTGAWGINGANYGVNGQVLTSQGPGLPPIWMAGGGGGGGSGVTLVNVSGGTTGLTTVGGPITSTGTITLTGTLNVASGGTGLTAVPGQNGSLFFNNNNTFAEIPGMRFDGSSNLFVNGLTITTEDNFTAFSNTFPITIKPGAARVNSAFAANLTLSGGDNTSSIYKAGDVVISGGVNPTPVRSGTVILRTNNTDRLTISATGAYGVPTVSGTPNYGTAGQVLVSQGPNNPPVWQDGAAGTGTAGVIAVLANSPLTSTGGNTPTISLTTVPTNLGGTGFSSYTVGDILYANTASALERLNIGLPGQVLSVVSGKPAWASITGAVTSFSGGTSGLTPSTATGGAIEIGGRLNIGFGGTGANNKSDAYNNLSPSLFKGDISYHDGTSNIRLPIGAPGSVLTSVNGIPGWYVFNNIPDQTGNRGRFMTTDGSSISWSPQIYWSDGPTLYGRSLTLEATNGDSSYSGSPGGNVVIKGGNNGGPVNGGGGSVIVQLGFDPSAGFFSVRNSSSTELFKVSKDGSLSFGSSGSNYGTAGQVLSSTGPNTTPQWIDAPVVGVTQIVAGNSNILVSPSSGTGIVTISAIGGASGGVTSFSGGSTGLQPNTASTGTIVLTGTLLTTSGGTGLNSYATGDILYASSPSTLTKLVIGSSGQVLTVGGGVPQWSTINALPSQTGNSGRFLATDGTNPSWNSQVIWSGGGPYDQFAGRSITIQATDGDTNYSGFAAGSVLIRGGNNGGVSNGGGGNITLQMGYDPTAGYLNVRSNTTELFRITRTGSWSLGSSGTAVGTTGQALISAGASTNPSWQNIVNSIVAGPNISISQTGGTTGTGVVTISASGEFSLTTATTATLGGIKIGTGVTITADGTLSATGVTSTATTSTLGLVKIGSGLTITSSGTLSVSTVEPFELAMAATGRVATGTLFIYTAARTFTMPANLTGSYATALTQASANATILIYRLTAAGVLNNIGSVLFAAGQNKGTFTFASTVTVAPGDTIYMNTTSNDATLSDISITINATLV